MKLVDSFAGATLNGLIGAMSRMPRFLLRPFVDFIVVMTFFFAKKETNQLYKNIEMIYKLPRHSQFARDFARQCIRHQVNSSLESLQEIVVGNRVRIDGLSEYKRFIQTYNEDQKGLAIITGHLGSWELMGKYSAIAFDGELSVLAKPAKQPFVTEALDTLRQKMAVKVIWTSSKKLLRDMMGVIKNKQALGFVMDQKPRKRVGLSIDFMGYPAEFVWGPAQIARKTGCPVVAAFCVRQGPFHYRLVFSEVSRNSDEMTEEELTRAMAAQIEVMIKRYPEQWTWNYKRWRFDGLQ